MEGRFRFLFLLIPVLAFGLPGCASNKSAPPPAEVPEQVVDPEVERREVKEPEIDTEDFEIGAFAGVLSIEDFGSDLVYGLRLAYHVTEGFFVEGTVGGRIAIRQASGASNGSSANGRSPAGSVVTRSRAKIREGSNSSRSKR